MTDTAPDTRIAVLQDYFPALDDDEAAGILTVLDRAAVPAPDTRPRCGGTPHHREDRTMPKCAAGHQMIHCGKCRQCRWCGETLTMAEYVAARTPLDGGPQ